MEARVVRMEYDSTTRASDHTKMIRSRNIDTAVANLGRAVTGIIVLFTVHSQPSRTVVIYYICVKQIVLYT